MQTTNNVYSLLVQKHTTHISEGFIYAKKHNLGAYPGIQLDSTNTNKTVGELYLITGNKTLLFKHLDAYEGFVSIETQDNLFIRKQVPVYTNEKIITAWVYEYAKPID